MLRGLGIPCEERVQRSVHLLDNVLKFGYNHHSIPSPSADTVAMSYPVRYTVTTMQYATVGSIDRVACIEGGSGRL
ncbi:MAG: hypothetical protein NVS2B16_18100 [Chloroflexota bacterium]